MLLVTGTILGRSLLRNMENDSGNFTRQNEASICGICGGGGAKKSRARKRGTKSNPLIISRRVSPCLHVFLHQVSQISFDPQRKVMYVPLTELDHPTHQNTSN